MLASFSYMLRLCKVFCGLYMVFLLLLIWLFLTGGISRSSAADTSFLKITDLQSILPYQPLTHEALETYSAQTLKHHLADIPYDTAGVALAIVGIGLKSWNWSESRSFRFQNEGWFGRNTGSGGIDKLGHAFSSYLLANFFTDRIRMTSSAPEGAAITGGLLSASIMTAVEVVDGFAIDHGFSYEDYIMNMAGIAFSVLRNSIPGLREKIDFRQLYMPKSLKNARPMLDYENKRFLLALKLGGFEKLQATPLRFVELQVGYRAYGFSAQARRQGIKKTRHLFIGIGINLEKLLFGNWKKDENLLKWAGRFALEHFQVPYTASHMNLR